MLGSGRGFLIVCEIFNLGETMICVCVCECVRVSVTSGLERINTLTAGERERERLDRKRNWKVK